jgi:hypothetical protein
METVVLDKTLLILFGSGITILLAVIGYFSRLTHSDIKTMLQDHEVRIQNVEKHKERIEERHINTSAIVEEIKTKLDLIYQRGE